MTERQIYILMSLKSSPSIEKNDADLLDSTINGKLSHDGIDRLCKIINDEYLMKGIEEDYNPNEYGLELEELLDLVNHDRLHGFRTGRAR